MGHTIAFRTPAPTIADTWFVTALADVNAFFTALAPLLFNDFAFTDCSFQAAGTLFSVPAPPPAPITPGGGSPTKGDAPRFISFVGRSSGGRKVALTVYGVTADPGNSDQAISQDYRLLYGEQAQVAAAITVLVYSSFSAVDGPEPVTWKQYANLGYNSHFQRKLRNM